MLLRSRCRVCHGVVEAGWNGRWYHRERARHSAQPVDPWIDAALEWEAQRGELELIMDWRERERRLNVRGVR